MDNIWARPDADDQPSRRDIDDMSVPHTTSRPTTA